MWARKKIQGDEAIKIGIHDLQRLFDFFVRRSLRERAISLYPENRSMGRVKDAIHRFLENKLKIEYGTGIDIVLTEKNIQHFISVIDKAKEKYQKEVSKQEPVLKFVKNGMFQR